MNPDNIFPFDRMYFLNCVGIEYGDKVHASNPYLIYANMQYDFYIDNYKKLSHSKEEWGKYLLAILKIGQEQTPNKL